MGLPQTTEARLYYRAAKQRFADAQLLLAAGRTTGAIYLAGYTVECEMTIKLRVKRPDPVLRQIVGAVNEFAQAHPEAVIGAYRHDSVSVRIRILDPNFAGRSRAQREEEVWAALEKLPEETVSEISLLLLLTPEEAKHSFASSEFDDPIPSKL